jgi:hypothetical protein
MIRAPVAALERRVHVPLRRRACVVATVLAAAQVVGTDARA